MVICFFMKGRIKKWNVFLSIIIIWISQKR